jgi:hypothetical protein
MTPPPLRLLAAVFAAVAFAAFAGLIVPMPPDLARLCFLVAGFLMVTLAFICWRAEG